MPNQHRYPAVVFRPPPELHARAKDTVRQAGSDLNAHLVSYLRWLVGDTDQLPARPAGSGDGSR